MVDYAFKENEYTQINTGIATKLSHENFTNINNNINYLYNKYKNGARGVLYAYKITESVNISANSDSSFSYVNIPYETPTISFESQRIYLLEVYIPSIVSESLGGATYETISINSQTGVAVPDAIITGANGFQRIDAVGLYPSMNAHYFLFYNYSIPNNRDIFNDIIKLNIFIVTASTTTSKLILEQPILFLIRDIGEYSTWV